MSLLPSGLYSHPTYAGRDASRSHIPPPVSTPAASSTYTPASSGVFSNDSSSQGGADTADGSEAESGEEGGVTDEGAESGADDVEEYRPARAPQRRAYLDPALESPNTVSGGGYWRPQVVPQPAGPTHYVPAQPKASATPMYTPYGSSIDRLSWAGPVSPQSLNLGSTQPLHRSTPQGTYPSHQARPPAAAQATNASHPAPPSVRPTFPARTPFTPAPPPKKNGYVRRADKGPRPPSKKYPARPQKQKVFYPATTLNRSGSGSYEVHEIARMAGPHGGGKRDKKASRACPLCGKMFETEHRLKDHLQSPVHASQAVNWGGGGRGPRRG